MKNKRNLIRWLKILIVVYCLIGTLFYYLQDRFLFHPVTLDAGSAWQFTGSFREANIKVDAATNYNIIQFTLPDSVNRGLVLYFHGNRENVNHYASAAGLFTRNGYEVWMPDYPGFGKSTGELTEQVLYDEALQVYKLARTRFLPGQIIIYGRSLGSGIAAHLAAERDCRRLVLETPYYSMQSIVQRFFWMYPVEQLLHYKLNTYQYLPKVTAPITIFHGTSDGVISYHNSERLKTVLKASDEFVTVAGGSHNDLSGFPLMQKKLDSLLRN